MLFIDKAHCFSFSMKAGCCSWPVEERTSFPPPVSSLGTMPAPSSCVQERSSRSAQPISHPAAVWPALTAPVSTEPAERREPDRARFWLCGFRDKPPLDESAAARARASVLHALPAHCLVGELSHSVELLLHLVFFGRASSQISLIEWSQVSALLCARQTGSFGRQISGWCIAGDRHGDAGDGVGANSCSFRWWGLDLCHWFRFAAQKMLDQLLSRCWQLDAAVGALWEM